MADSHRLKIKNILAILLLASVYFFAGEFSGILKASAAPEEKMLRHSGVTPSLAFKSPLSSQASGYKFFWMKLANYYWHVDYSAQSSIASGTGPLVTPLKVGDRFTITDTTHSNDGSIFWSATGSYADTPYGYWNAGAALNASRYDNIYDFSGGFGNEGTMDASLSFNTYDPDTAGSSKMAVGVGVAGDQYFENFSSACSPTSAGELTETVTGSNPPIVCNSVADYTWECEVVNMPASGQASVKMVYGCTHGAFYYRAYRPGETNSIPGSCSIRGQLCNYYEGIFQTKLITSSDLIGNSAGGIGSVPLVSGTPGLCSDILASGQYCYPPQAPDDGCRCPSTWCLNNLGRTECLRTGPKQCVSGAGDFRPIVATKEIVFTYKIASPDFALDATAARDGDAGGGGNWSAMINSEQVPLNGVDFKIGVSEVTDKIFTPGASVTYKIDCQDNGASYEHVFTDNIDSYISLDKCNYSAVGTYMSKVQVIRDGVIHDKEIQIKVDYPSTCGPAVSKEDCSLVESNTDLCINSGTASGADSGSFSDNGSSFSWTCKNGAINCSAVKKCPADAVWEESTPQ